jgi:hypothetical protein
MREINKACHLHSPQIPRHPTSKLEEKFQAVQFALHSEAVN